MQRQLGTNLAVLATSEYRAIDGRIGITHTGTGEYKTISVTEGRKRLKEVESEFRDPRLKKSRGFPEVERFIGQMRNVLREAEDQGPPEEPDILRERVRRRKSSIYIPGYLRNES